MDKELIERIAVEEWSALNTGAVTDNERRTIVEFAKRLTTRIDAERVKVERRFNCFAVDNGCDQWFDCPDDAEILSELDVEHVGQEFELLAGWRSERATFRVTKEPDAQSDDFEVECISHPKMIAAAGIQP